MNNLPDTSATALGALLCFVWGAFLLGWLVHRSRIISDTVQWFRKSSTPRRIAAVLIVAGLVAFGGSKGTNSPNDSLSIPLSLLNTGSHIMPDWYVARGYSQTDSDGDGLPDVWEKWTRTNPYVDDASLDPDHDGVTNFEEFLYQCDPMRADTDGDGLGDRMEIDGLVAEVEDMNPLVRATYHVTETDTDADGIPDLWGDPQDYVRYTDWNSDGYCDAQEYDFEQLTNSVGVVFHVTSSRSCALSTGVGAPLFLPACTNFAVRPRISTDSDTQVTLYGAPDDTYVRSTWKARLVAEWEDDGTCEIENDRIRTGDGVILDMSTTCADFAGALLGEEPLRGMALLGAHAEPVSNENSIGIWFWRKAISLSGTAMCSIHGPYPVITATCTGVEPPLHWEITGTSISEDTGTIFSPSIVGSFGDSLEIVCSKIDGHSDIVVQTKVRYAPAHCEPSVTNIVGASWTSTHDPHDASDHEPGIETTTEQFGPNCPPTTIVTIRAGFTHNPEILHYRNLVRILTGDVEYDETDHCIGIVWSKDFSVDLNDFLDTASREITDRLRFRANGLLVPDGILNYRDGAPSQFSPKVIHITIEDTDTNQILDRLWMTIYSRTAQSMFDNWFSEESSDLSWTENLPPPFESIVIGTTSSGTAVIGDPEPHGSVWNPPEEVELSNYIHHHAAYEMRSTPVSGGHGHQATYDSDGDLICDPIAAGTADKVSPNSIWNESTIDHRNTDVLPFINALQMDGNPAETTNMTGLFSESIPTRLTKPCLYYGEYLRKYIQCRPVLPTGTRP